MWKATAEHQRFDESADWLLRRTVVDEATRHEIPADARARAFWIAGAAQLDVVNDVFTELRRSSDEGIGYEEFRKNVRQSLLQQWGGVEPPHRIRLIYRNATTAALNAGRYQQMRDPAVMQYRPYWLYDAVRPTPCPSEICTELDGRIFHAEDPRIDRLYPPNHHGCQSGFRAIRSSEATRRGGVSRDPIEHAPQDGFGLSPALSRPWVPTADGRDPDLLAQLRVKVDELSGQPDPLENSLQRDEHARRLREQGEALRREQEGARRAMARRRAEREAAERSVKEAAERAAGEAAEAEARRVEEDTRRLAEEAARKAAEAEASREAARRAEDARQQAARLAKQAEAEARRVEKAAAKAAEKARKLEEKAKAAAEKAAQKAASAANNAEAYRNAGIRVDDLNRIKRVSKNVFGRELSPDDVRALGGLSGHRVEYSITTLGDSEVSLFGFVYGEDGTQLVKITREYKRAILSGKRVAHHTLMEVAESARGTGIGRQLFENQVAAYGRLGIEEITTEAAWDGRYVWPRFGFELRDPTKLSELKSSFGSWLKDSGAASEHEAAELLANVRSIRDLSVSRIGMRRVGREWLTTKFPVKLSGESDAEFRARARKWLETRSPVTIDLRVSVEKAARFAALQAEEAAAAARRAAQVEAERRAAREAAELAAEQSRLEAERLAAEVAARKAAAIERARKIREAAEARQRAREAEEAERKAAESKVWTYFDVASKRPQGGLVAPYMPRKPLPGPPPKSEIAAKSRKLRMQAETDTADLDLEGKGMLQSYRYTPDERRRVLEHQEHGARQFLGDPATGAPPTIHEGSKEAVIQFSYGYDYTIRQMSSGSTFDAAVKSRIEHVTGQKLEALTERQLAAFVPAAEDHVREAWVAAQNIERAFRDAEDALIKTTYRGICDLDDATLDRFLGSDHFDFQGKVSSTSTSFGIASKFAIGDEGHSVIFKLARKSKGIEITSVSKVATEDEVLVHGNTRWRITNRTRLFGDEGLGQKWLIEAEELVD